jgi:hypothetical protein
MATTQEPPAEPRAGKSSRRGGPLATVKFGSAVVPVYRSTSNGRTRYILSYHRDGKRMRQILADLPAGKKEALFVAQRIQTGMQQVTDIKPHERETTCPRNGRLRWIKSSSCG